MKKYLIKIFFFFMAVAVLDILFGFACQYLNTHSKGGGTKSRYYVCKESNEDVLIFGSSRAKHHYVPDIFEDSLGVTCYNTGEDGNGIIFCYGVLNMITNRYAPKLIIYDVSGFDMYEDDNMKYLDLMKPFYNEQGIDSIFWSVNPKTRIMMNSNLYRYNTTCLSLLGNYIHPMQNYPKGYSALFKKMDYEPVLKEPSVKITDTLKIKYFAKFISLAQRYNINLICCVSPTYKGSPDDFYYLSIKNLCNKYETPFLYYNADTDFVNDKKLFEDRVHLNDVGAHLYTSKLSSWIMSHKLIEQ